MESISTNEKKLCFLLIGGNYSPELTGIGKYNGDMMEWLASQGFPCTVVTTYPYYPYWAVQNPYQKRSWWYKKEILHTPAGRTVIYRCPHYVPKNPTGLKRVFSDISYTMSSSLVIFLLLFRKKADVVMSVVPPFQLGLLGLFYKWMKGAKMVYHIQDLQIDAAKELGMIKSSLLLRMMFRMECFILKKADFVSSISYGMIRKIKAKFERPVLFFPNWVDTGSFSPIADRASLKKQFNIDPTKKVVLYSGAIGEKQGLDVILRTAPALDPANVHFIICGSGPYKDRLIEMQTAGNIRNIAFFPLQDKAVFNEFLNMADVHLVLQKADANDLVMPSKLTTILAVGGLAVVTAPPESSLNELVAEFNMGIIAKPEDDAAFIEAIHEAISSDHNDIRTNARNFAMNYLQIGKVISKFIGDISV